MVESVWMRQNKSDRFLFIAATRYSLLTLVRISIWQVFLYGLIDCWLQQRALIRFGFYHWPLRAITAVARFFRFAHFESGLAKRKLYKHVTYSDSR